MRIADYAEHSLGSGADAAAVCYVEAQVAGGRPVFGVGMHRNIVTASLNAIISAVNRAVERDGRLAGSERATLEKDVPVVLAPR